jgi:hypothetical protein
VEFAAGHGGDGFGVEVADHAGTDDSEFHGKVVREGETPRREVRQGVKYDARRISFRF